MADTNLAVQGNAAYALCNGWLESRAGTVNGTVATLTANTSNIGTALNAGISTMAGYYPNNYQQSWWYYPSPTPRPIRLGLSEVEKLRSAAKRDAKLKKILEKFTDQIEVVVDFK